MSHRSRQPARFKDDGFNDIRFEGEITQRDIELLRSGRLSTASHLSGERDPGFIPDLPNGRKHSKFVRCPGCGGKVVMPCVYCTMMASPHVTRIERPRRKNASA